MTAISKDIEGVAANYTQQYPGMCKKCAEAITLVVESNQANGNYHPRYYFTNESETSHDEVICKCKLRIHETFTKLSKDGW